MAEYSLAFAEGWDENLKKFDKTVQFRLMKKMAQLRGELKSRHLKHGVPFFVEEVSGYRIAFKIIEEERTKRIEFVGTHKQYEKWYSNL
jgi:mRNA-degrading endonuclease RelE of RelBE toxin-antitoxin system